MAESAGQGEAKVSLGFLPASPLCFKGGEQRWGHSKLFGAFEAGTELGRIVKAGAGV